MFRCLVLGVGLLAAASTATLAGKNAGGALIVHTNDAYQYYRSTCARFETVDSPGSCEAAGTRTDKDELSPVMIWLIAAFPAGASPGVSSLDFGLRHNLPIGLEYINNWRFCGPAGTGEQPDAGWPELGGNTVTFGSPVSGDAFFPYYTLNVYGYAGAYVGTSEHPGLEYAAFHDDSVPPVVDPCVRFGQVAWHAAGYNDCPDSIVGACCFHDGRCELLSEATCTASGGAALPGEPTCDPNPCLEIPGACCFPGAVCETRTAQECDQAGGLYVGIDVPCEPNRCAEVGACCFLDGSCQELLPEDCVAPTGNFEGAGSTCAAGACSAIGACCLAGGACELRFEPQCLAAGGTFVAGFTSCDPSPCFGACCYYNGVCSLLDWDFCLDSGGHYEGSATVCEPNPCPQPGACCFEDDHCEYLAQEACLARAGAPKEPGSGCDPNPCPTAGAPDDPPAVRSWGSIKALYH